MRHWRNRKQEYIEWDRQLLSGDLLRELRDYGAFKASETVMVSSEGNIRRVPLRELASISASANGTKREKRAAFAAGAMEAADWEAESPATAFSWLIAAGGHGAGQRGWKAIEGRFSAEEVVKAWEGQLEKACDWGRGAHAIMIAESLKGTPVQELWGRMIQGAMALDKAMEDDGAMSPRYRWKLAERALDVSISAAEWLRSEAIGGGHGGKVGKRLRKWLEECTKGESLEGVSKVLSVASERLSEKDKARWGEDALRLLDPVAGNGWKGFEEAKAVLEALKLASAPEGRREKRAVFGV